MRSGLPKGLRALLAIMGLVALVAALALPGAAAAKTVPGNNGTVKIHDGGVDGDQSGGANDIDNDPHVCTFHLHFYFADAGQAGTWWIETWPPSGGKGTVVLSGTYLTDANGEFRTPASPGFYTLPDGHYKLFWEGRNDKNIKMKVFWVACKQATPSPTPTSSQEQETATPTMEETATPTMEETATPTMEETATPTEEATATPTMEETATPTMEETATPTMEETATPTSSQEEETATPTMEETATPTATQEEESATPTMQESESPTSSVAGETATPVSTATPTEAVGGVTAGTQATPPPTSTGTTGLPDNSSPLRVALFGFAMFLFALAVLVPAMPTRRRR